jgi:hypothetical protein
MLVMHVIGRGVVGDVRRSGAAVSGGHRRQPLMSAFWMTAEAAAEATRAPARDSIPRLILDRMARAPPARCRAPARRLRLFPVNSAMRDEPKAIEVITRPDTMGMPRPFSALIATISSTGTTFVKPHVHNA